MEWSGQDDRLSGFYRKLDGLVVVGWAGPIVSIGSELHRKLNSIFLFFFYIHKTLFGLSGIQSGSYSECLKKIILRDPTMRINCGTIAGGGKSVFLVHMSDSTLQIAPRSPGKPHKAWDSGYIGRHTLRLYFQEDIQVC